MRPRLRSLAMNYVTTRPALSGAVSGVGAGGAARGAAPMRKFLDDVKSRSNNDSPQSRPVVSRGERPRVPFYELVTPTQSDPAASASVVREGVPRSSTGFANQPFSQHDIPNLMEEE